SLGLDLLSQHLGDSLQASWHHLEVVRPEVREKSGDRFGHAPVPEDRVQPQGDVDELERFVAQIVLQEIPEADAVEGDAVVPACLPDQRPDLLDIVPFLVVDLFLQVACFLEAQAWKRQLFEEAGDRAANQLGGLHASLVGPQIEGASGTAPPARSCLDLMQREMPPADKEPRPFYVE